MSARRFQITVAAAALLVGCGTWWMYQRMFGTPIAEANARTAQLTVRVSELQAAIKKTADARARLTSIAEAALGADAESVVHELRVALTEIGAGASINGVTVDSRHAGDVKSPAAKAFTDSRKLRDAPDFGVVEGSLRGTASYQQAAEAIALVESQPWPKRIKSVTLEPTGKEPGAPLAFTMTIETLYVPGKSTRRAGKEDPLRPVAPEKAALVQRIAAHNLFTRPEPAPQLAAAPMSPAPQAPEGRWIVTGWAEGSAGWELWIRSTRDQQTRSIRVGERVQDCTFVGVRDGYAVLDTGGQRFAIALGEAVEARDRRIE